METTLLIVTAVSLLMALAMSYTAWRLGREERQRAAARVAALTAAAGASPAELSVAGANTGLHRIDQARSPWARSTVGISDTRPPAPLSVDARAATVREDTPLFDDRIHPAAAAAPSSAADSRLFLGSSEEPKASAGRQRGLAAAAAVLFVVMLGGLVWTMSSRAPSVASAASQNAPLELVSLRHERQSSKLAVSGLVRNPAAGHPVDRLSAVVFLFDQQGAFVASAKAPVDFVRLGSGDESPFVITLDAPANIARYRVSFRTDQGIVPHVDRRNASPIASQAEQATSLPVK